MFSFFNIENGILEPEFQNDIESYYVSISEDVDSLDLDFKLEPGTKINVVGNNDLKIGDNYVFIELEKEGMVKTYRFLVNKEETATVFNYEEPVRLEIEENKKEPIDYTPIIILVCIFLIIVIFKTIFKSNKKQLNR